MKILFVVHSLGGGGAERQLSLLATGMAERGHDVSIAVSQPGGRYAEPVRSAGVEIKEIKPGRTLGVQALSKLLKRGRFDVAYSFLPESNWKLALASLPVRRTVVVWGLRASKVDRKMYGRRTQIAWQLARVTSRIPDLIIANSNAGAEHHISKGYPRRRVKVIPNGIDTDIFRPAADIRDRFRAGLGYEPETPVVGVLGRFDPAKGQLEFVDVFARVVASVPTARALFAGAFTTEQRELVVRRAREAGIASSIDLIGESTEPEAVLNAIDVLALPSQTEAFPNVIAEAMACGTVCVAYDVGDVRSIIVPPCVIAPANDVVRFASEISQALQRRESAEDALRQSIIARFGVGELLDRTEAEFLAQQVGWRRQRLVTAPRTYSG